MGSARRLATELAPQSVATANTRSDRLRRTQDIKWPPGSEKRNAARRVPGPCARRCKNTTNGIGSALSSQIVRHGIWDPATYVRLTCGQEMRDRVIGALESQARDHS